MRKLLAVLLLSPACWAQQYVISTIAGGAPLPSPVAATSVPLTGISGIATDPSGNVYFSASNSVFKLDSTGTLTLLAGNSRPGFSGDGGPATSAQLSSPGGIVVDKAGNVFVADSGNGRVRKISASGMIVTVAGGGNGQVYFSSALAATAASLGNIGGLALDASGDLFISDSSSEVVRMVSPKGVITTVAGNGAYGYSGDGGPAIQARLSDPNGLVIDQLGNLFIADTGNNCVRKVSSNGSITTFAGTGFPGFSGDNGLAVTAQMASPRGVALDGSGNLLITDSVNSRIRKVSSSGMITTLAGNGTFGLTGDGGPASSAQLINPLDIAVDQAGNVFIDNSLSPGSPTAVERSGDFSGTVGLIGYPTLFFLPPPSTGASVLRKISTAGTISTVAGTASSGLYGMGGPAVNAKLGSVSAVAADNNGNVFVADSADNSVLKISAAGAITLFAGNGTYGFAGDGGLATQAELANPVALATDSAGNLFIADQNNSRIRKVTPNGIITTVAGDGDAGYAGDGGLAINAEIARPTGVAVDGSGNIFILDTANSVVRKVAANGIVTTFAGNGTTGYAGDNGPANQATFYDPMGIAVDTAGNLYIADTYNFAVREVTASTGIVTTVPGSLNSANEPSTVAVDNAGNLLFSQTGFIARVSATGTLLAGVAGTGISGDTGDGGMAASAEIGNVAGMAVDSRGNVYIADSSSYTVRKLTPTSQTVLISAVLDAASERPAAISPGEIIAIFGSGMGFPGPFGSFTASPSGGVFGTTLGGTTVSVNGIAAPIFYASATQVNAVVPYGVTGATAVITVAYQSGISAGFSVPLAATSPAFFTYNATGAGQAAAFNVVDGTLNTAANPVKIGGYIEMFFTGGGQTSPGGVDGKLAATPLPSPLAAVTATIGGVQAVVQYKGDESGVVDGLMQLNLLVPPGVAIGGYVPVVLTVGTSSTATGTVWIAVSN